MKIDFYLFETTSSQKSWYFACQVIESIFTTQQKPIDVNMKTREEAERFDALLWTYRDHSFMPHHLCNETDEHSSLIQIGFSNPPQAPCAILFNLAPNVPIFYKQYQHVIEIVFNDPLVQQLARERYKQYREQQCAINTIKYKADEHD